MSKATKRKHVLIEVLQDDFSPPQDKQQIVKVVCSRGNNLHEVQTPSGEKFLVSMPVKFRKNVWVKRGDYIIIEPIDEGDKVKAEMVRPLTAEHVKCFKKDGCWPGAFDDDISKTDSDDVNGDLVPNVNRINCDMNASSSSSESDSELTDSSSASSYANEK